MTCAILTRNTHTGENQLSNIHLTQVRGKFRNEHQHILLVGARANGEGALYVAENGRPVPGSEKRVYVKWTEDNAGRVKLCAEADIYQQMESNDVEGVCVPYFYGYYQHERTIGISIFEHCIDENASQSALANPTKEIT